MSWIVFENEGEADVFALTTFGVSAKNSDNPIGFFGTGFKYAMAVILRAGGKIVVQTGDRSMTVSSREKQSRAESFWVVTLSGRELGFTTQLGKGWPLWAAYRELYCNMLDEGGSARIEKRLPVAEAGKTRICVSLDKLMDVHARRDTIILSAAVRMAGKEAQAHWGSSPVVFYRGMRAMDLPKPSLITWNLLEQLTLTEDRTIMHQHLVGSLVARTLLACTDESLIEEVLSAPPEAWESEVNFTGWGSSIRPSDAFLDTTERLRRDTGRRINHSAISVLARWRQDSRQEITGEALDEEWEKDMAWAAQVMAVGLGADLSLYPVKVVDSLGAGVLGEATRNPDTIWISKEALVQGRMRLLGTLYEEWLHLRMGYSDESRSMQNWLVDRCANLAAQLWKEKRERSDARRPRASEEG